MKYTFVLQEHWWPKDWQMNLWTSLIVAVISIPSDLSNHELVYDILEKNSFLTVAIIDKYFMTKLNRD